MSKHFTFIMSSETQISNSWSLHGFLGSVCNFRIRTVDPPVDVWWGGMNLTHRTLSHNETGWSSWSCPVSNQSLRGRPAQLQTTPGGRKKWTSTFIFVLCTGRIIPPVLMVQLVYDYADSVGGKRLLPLSVSIPQAELCLGQSWPPACCSTASTSTPLLHPSVAQGASFIIQSGFHSYHIVLCCKYVLCMQARMKNMTFNFKKIVRDVNNHLQSLFSLSTFVFLYSSSRWQTGLWELSPWSSPIPPSTVWGK